MARTKPRIRTPLLSRKRAFIDLTGTETEDGRRPAPSLRSFRVTKPLRRTKADQERDRCSINVGWLIANKHEKTPVWPREPEAAIEQFMIQEQFFEHSVWYPKPQEQMQRLMRTLSKHVNFSWWDPAVHDILWRRAVEKKIDHVRNRLLCEGIIKRNDQGGFVAVPKAKRDVLTEERGTTSVIDLLPPQSPVSAKFPDVTSKATRAEIIDTDTEDTIIVDVPNEDPIPATPPRSPRSPRILKAQTLIPATPSPRTRKPSPSKTSKATIPIPTTSSPRTRKHSSSKTLQLDERTTLHRNDITALRASYLSRMSATKHFKPLPQCYAEVKQNAYNVVYGNGLLNVGEGLGSQKYTSPLSMFSGDNLAGLVLGLPELSTETLVPVKPVVVERPSISYEEFLGVAMEAIRIEYAS